MSARGKQDLQDWEPVPGTDASLDAIIKMAFAYRGDVTVLHHDGSRTVGYLFNRDIHSERPFVQIYPTRGGAALTISLSQVAGIRFTGLDTAAGHHYEAWKLRKESAPAQEQSE